MVLMDDNLQLLLYQSERIIFSVNFMSRFTLSKTHTHVDFKEHFSERESYMSRDTVMA